MPKTVQDETGKIYPVFWISLAAIFGLPVIVYFLAGSPMDWDYPVLKGFNFKGGLVLRPEFIALWLALSLYTAAFIAEIVRAGIQAISYGQTEAAYALGHQTQPYHATGHNPAGVAGHNPAAFQPVSERHQEFLARDRDRLYGYRRDDWGYIPQPDRARNGMYDHRSGTLSSGVADDIQFYELVQQTNEAGGAIT